MPADSVVASIFDEPPKPWGGWATLGLSAAVFGLFTLIQFVVFAVIVVTLLFQARGTAMDLEAIKALGQTGWAFAIATWATWPPCLLLICFFAWLRRDGTARDYLALTRPPWAATACWLLAACAANLVMDWATWRLGREVVTGFQLALYRTAIWPPGLWSAVIIAAPVGEEIFFRGFMFRGLQASRVGWPGAILITSLAFAAIHLQYDLYHMGVCFVLGLVFGLARLGTGSTTVPILMHALTNLIATIATEWVM